MELRSLTDLHITGIPEILVNWLKVRKAKTGMTISQQICNFIYDSEDYERFMMKAYLKNRDMNSELSIDEILGGGESK